MPNPTLEWWRETPLFKEVIPNCLSKDEIEFLEEIIENLENPESEEYFRRPSDQINHIDCFGWRSVEDFCFMLPPLKPGHTWCFKLQQKIKSYLSDRDKLLKD